MPFVNTVGSAKLDHFGPRAFDPVSRKDTELYLKKVKFFLVNKETQVKKK